MKRFRHIPYLPVFAALLLSAACGGQRTAEYKILTGFALGTTYKFIVDMPDTAGLCASIDSLLKEIDASLSVHNPGSLISRINRGESDSADIHIERNIEAAREFSEMSGGMYDVTIKPVASALGFAGGEAAGGDPNTDSLMQFVGYEKIEVRDGRIVKAVPGVQMDFSSIAKGYTVDMAGALMESRGAGDYLIEIGGEIYCRGRSPRGGEWNVAIDKPFDGNMTPGQATQAMISISDAGMATSGNYRQYYIDGQGRKVTHIIDAETGRPGQSDVLSATVIAESSMTADALATMFTLLGLERSVELLGGHPEWMGYLIYDDGKGGFAAYATDNLKAHILPER